MRLLGREQRGSTPTVPEVLDGDPVLGSWECVNRLSQDYWPILLLYGVFGGAGIAFMLAALYVDSAPGMAEALGTYIRFAALVVIAGAAFLVAANRRGRKERVALTSRGMFVDRRSSGKWSRSADLARLKTLHVTPDIPTGGAKLEVATSTSYDSVGPLSQPDTDELLELVVEHSAAPDTAIIADERKRPDDPVRSECA